MDLRQFVKRFLAYGVVGYVAIHLVIWAALLIGALVACQPDLYAQYGTLIVSLAVLLIAGTATAVAIRRRRSQRASEPDDS